MSWLEKLTPIRLTRSSGEKTRNFPEGVWRKCPGCSAVLYGDELARHQEVCPKCGFHLRIGARARLAWLLDAGEEGEVDMREIGAQVRPVDSLKFKDSKTYGERLAAAQQDTGETDSLVVVQGKIHGVGAVVAVLNFDFMAGTMGSVMGERFVQGVAAAIAARAAFVCFSASGGARMQEGVLSLMQMAKTSGALTRLADAKLPFISVLTDPTTGGVSASFAFLGDVVMAEPGALIGFAGPRVIEQTVREKLPKGFQRSEFLLEKGAVDRIVDRRKQRREIAHLIALLQGLPPTALDEHALSVAEAARRDAGTEAETGEPDAAQDEAQAAGGGAAAVGAAAVGSNAVGSNTASAPNRAA